MTPFITFLTPTYRRPKGLAQCLASVQAQTAHDEIQHIVIVDHVGVGIDGMYASLPTYATSVQGEYVHILCDDDVLETVDVVASVRDCARKFNPAVILVDVVKGPLFLHHAPWPPRLAEIDLGCMIVRRDVWLAHVHDYGKRYEGDFDFAEAVARAGHMAMFLPMLFLRGGQSHGSAEAA